MTDSKIVVDYSDTGIRIKNKTDGRAITLATIRRNRITFRCGEYEVPSRVSTTQMVLALVGAYSNQLQTARNPLHHTDLYIPSMCTIQQACQLNQLSKTELKKFFSIGRLARIYSTSDIVILCTGLISSPSKTPSDT